MKLIVRNIATQAIIGGSDHLKGDVYNLLREQLCVRPNNYYQLMQAMARRGVKGWDGYTYFLNKKGMFPTGFLPVVIAFCRTLGIKVTLEDNRNNVPLFIEGDWDWSAPDFALAKHQKKLVSSVQNYIDDLYFPRGTWKAATNAGKTAALGSLINNVSDPHALLLVDNAGLLKQHYEYYSRCFPGKVGVIKSSMYRIGAILTIAMVQTLYNRIKKIPSVQRDLQHKFNILAVDESHGFASKETMYVVNHVDAGMRIFMSGTPFDMDDKVAKLRLIGMSGTILHEVSKRYLMDKGYSMIPVISVYLNPTLSMYIDYDKEFDTVVLESVKRAELIADLILERRKKKIIITFNEEKHGRLMYEVFCEKYPRLAQRCTWVHGNDKLRDKKIAAFLSNRITILFSSTILQQGYNFPDIQVVIDAMGGKAKISINQWLGRGERLDGTNTHFEYITIFDQGKYMSKHSRKRLAYLRSQDLPEPITYHYKNRRGTPLK